MEVVIVLSALLIYLLLTINKGIGPGLKKADEDYVVPLEKSQLVKKCLFSPYWDLILQMNGSFIGRINGNSLKARGLVRNDIVVAKPVDKNCLNPKKGDLIIVKDSSDKMNMNSFFSIQEYAGELDNGFIQTICYKKFNPVKSTNHKTIDIIAIVQRHIKNDLLLKEPLSAN